jgi:hypothetical protein
VAGADPVLGMKTAPAFEAAMRQHQRSALGLPDFGHITGPSQIPLKDLLLYSYIMILS